MRGMRVRRAKIGASEHWFGRRRGGTVEAAKKDNGWRANLLQQEDPGAPPVKKVCG